MNSFPPDQRFLKAWNSVKIERSVNYGLFTFGESVLPYFLVCGAPKTGGTVTVTRGDVRVTRPLILTPDNYPVELQNFFEENDELTAAQFMLSRSAGFSHLKLDNHSGAPRIVSDSIEETVDRLNRELDGEDEDQVAILSAPSKLGGIAVLRYAAERIWSSTPDNIQELRERGFLP
ncbi:MAG: hypothetical protein O2955_16800 [Planctomycetota bacterium]|nr:hypothetical protein [Planctomycetota bacterium]MDA1214174.1 hypothetical protein [Planctomycetota bacterium]